MLESLYGKKQRFPNDQSILPIVEVLQFLQCPSIEQELCLSLSENFEEFGFFLVLRVSEKLQLEPLILRCYKELLVYNFEQIMINKIDFYDYDVASFISILRKHRLLQR